MSPLYPFILNQWKMGKDEVYIDLALSKGYITDQEKLLILETPKV